MKTLSAVTEPPKASPAAAARKKALMLALPVIVAVLLLLVPTPAGLEPYAWHFFAIFVGVIVGLIFEPLPGAVIGGLLIGLIEALWSAYFSIDYKDVAAFSILAIVLIFMPSGILGRPEVEKV